MNYSLSKKKAKELVEAKLSHFMGVSPEEATDEQYYKAIALIVRDMMSQGRGRKGGNEKGLLSLYGIPHGTFS